MLLPFRQHRLSSHNRTIPPIFQFHFLSRFQCAQNCRIRRQVADRLSGQLNQNIALLQPRLLRWGAGEGVVDAHAFALIVEIGDSVEAGFAFSQS